MVSGLCRGIAASFEEVIPRPGRVEAVAEGELRILPGQPWRVEIVRNKAAGGAEAAGAANERGESAAATGLGGEGAENRQQTALESASSATATTALSALGQALSVWRGVGALAEGDGEPVQLRLVLDPAAKGPVAGAYQILVESDGVTITAAEAAGMFYAVQSLSQLLPAPGEELRLERERVIDSPRFAWRGFMLDESRHFLGQDFVEATLRRMARYKLNRFHWHLTDSNGWRFEVPGFPELTEVGARGSLSVPDGPAQFYTRVEVAEILELAAELHIEVIPEIDMPGHANAVLRAFPQHAGEMNSPDPFTFNPVNPQTREFLQQLLRAVTEVFPDASMIHYGGDEVSFHREEWRENPEIMAWLAARDSDDLLVAERAFNRDMAAFIHDDLRREVGAWDEVALAQVPPDQVTLFWWRHDQPQLLAEALEAGYPVVLCPRVGLYLDFVQVDRDQQGRRWDGEFCGLEAVYRGWRADADAAIGAHPEQILGVQGNLWTEQVSSVARANYLTWPRLAAVAELGWTAENRRDFANFLQRLPKELAWLRGNGVVPFDPLDPEASPEVIDAELVKENNPEARAE